MKYDKMKGFSGDKRGLVGIGTLIIFIAMVIVAAVAAGVLINTSQSLQEQARATGEETIRSVSSGVNVLAVKGPTHPNSPEIQYVWAVVQTYPGSDGINLEETVIQVTTENKMGHFTYPDNIPDLAIDKIENVSGTKETMLGPGDTVKIGLSLQGQLGDNLAAGDSMSLTFIPPEGFDTYYGVNVPVVLRKGTWYEM